MATRKPAKRSRTSKDNRPTGPKVLTLDQTLALRNPATPTLKERFRLDFCAFCAIIDRIETRYSVGLPDEFQHHASREDLLAEAGLDAQGIRKSVLARWPALDAATQDTNRVRSAAG